MKKFIVLLLACFLLASVPAQATVSTTNNSTTLAANGVTTSWTFNFVADSADDLEVIVTDSTGQQTTLTTAQYAVALNPITTGELWSVGGTVTYPLSGSPLASGNSVTIQRLIPLQQNTDISNQGDFYPAVVEQALDTGVMQNQQLAARTGQVRGTWVTGLSYNYGDMVIDGANGNNTGNLYLCANANTSGTWSTDLANGDWSLALNIQGIANALPSIGNNQLFGNISGGTAAPTGVGGSAFLDHVFGSTQGSILYRNGSAWTVLTPGVSGQVLQTQGASANPQWASTAGAGTVTSVTCGSGLSGGTITSAGTCSVSTAADMSVMANVSGSTAVPSATTMSALLDYVFGNAQGDLLYRGGSTWGVLAPGTSGQFLKTNGAGANPAWASGSGAADVQTFTSSGTWTKPTGTKTFVECWGGGGSGGGGGGSGSGGGGGGAYCSGWYATSALSSTETVTIGAGGASAAGSGTNGNVGGNTTFGSHLTAYGGAGGTFSSPAGGGGGCLGAGSSGNGGSPLPATTAGMANAGFGGGNGGTSGAGGAGGYGGGGGGGTSGSAGGSSVYGGGGGGGGGGVSAPGSSVFGGAGGAGASSGAASAGTQPGGGGGGAGSSGATGAGAKGECIVTTLP